jgi:hypothetical protein
MTFARLYQFARELGQYPIVLEGVVDKKAMELTSQDELCYVPLDLDPQISLGHIKQYRVQNGVYNADPTWVTEIRYLKTLNVCWKRYVCCKELMHVFDNEEERTNTADKFMQLVEEIETPLPGDKASPMYETETRTLWMAVAILCPENLRQHFQPDWEAKKLSDYDVALELRIPEVLIKTIMSPSYETMVPFLTEHFAC